MVDGEPLDDYESSSFAGIEARFITCEQRVVGGISLACLTAAAVMFVVGQTIGGVVAVGIIRATAFVCLLSGVLAAPDVVLLDVQRRACERRRRQGRLYS